jgi:hypothetical protein
MVGFAPGYAPPTLSAQCQQLQTLDQLSIQGPTFQSPSSAAWNNGKLIVVSNQQVYNFDLATSALTLATTLPNTDLESATVGKMGAC